MKIGVVGLGLIGGSIFKDLNRLGYDCIGISQSQKNIKNVYSDYKYLSACDLIFVCKEMSKTIRTLRKIEKYVLKKTIVTDVCSLKKFLTAQSYNFNFIPSHPMAGTEFSGWQNAQEGLFKGAKWVITPLNKGYQPCALENVIKDLGAEIVYTTPHKHDEAVGLISHAPMVLAQALYKTVEHNKLALKLASSGFRDMTRLALSSVDMANDMLSLNSKNIRMAFLKLYSNLGDLMQGNYKRQITTIKRKREKMYKEGKNIL